MKLFRGKKQKNREGEHSAPFIFSWKKTKNPSWLLGVFIAFSALVHGSGFYLFQVVYPAPVRVEPTPDRITILDPAYPATRSTIQRVKDRTVFLHPPSENSGVRVRLSDHAARLSPSFKKIQPAFLPPRDEHSRLPSPPDAGEPVPPAGEKLTFRLSPNLKKRGIAPWSILSDYLSESEVLPSLRINLRVLPDGKIGTASVQGVEIPDSARAEFNRAVESTLRFRPLRDGASENSEPGWIEIEPKQP